MALYRNLILSCLLLFQLLTVNGQAHTFVLSGKILGADQQPLAGVNIKIKDSPKGTYSDTGGKFKLLLEAGKDTLLVFSMLNYETTTLSVSGHQDREIVRVMKPVSIHLNEVEVRKERKQGAGVVNIDPLQTRNLTSAGGGAVEQLVKSLPGVSSHSELSPQYSVRGGNYDENLLYVNGIEIFRPFLVKTGEQEGLSFLNPDLVAAIRFSSGGFESSYGDKMSSVLDIDYKVPTRHAGTAEIGALGASVHLEGKAMGEKFTYLTGLRYRDNRYLLGTLDQKGHYDPSSFDWQLLLGYDFSKKFSVSLLANLARNNYNFTPETRETNFGTMSQSYLLKIYFEGNEKDQFSNRFGALSANYHPSSALNLQFTASSFYSDEKERYDILGQYYLNEVLSGADPSATPDSSVLLGVGSSLLHAGNFLRASILNLEHRGKFLTDHHRIQWGVKFQSERINDQVNEWEMRDSAGYSMPYTNRQVELYHSIRADNNLNSNRYHAFVQDNFTTRIRNSTLSINIGGRFQYWDYNQQAIFSPRVSAIFLPERLQPLQLHAAWGLYQQMPFFKELKNREAKIVPGVRAQKSEHFVVGADYPCRWGGQPFKFSTELWYKRLTNLIPYKITNLDLQYFPEQQSGGYATGLEMKIFGEPVPGAVSWASVTIMKTGEDIIGDQLVSTGSSGNPVTTYPGYLARPSDQRFNFSLFFQDYLPKNPNVKMNLTLLYGSGIPFGPPRSERYLDVFRMPPYRRVDLGISRMLFGIAGQKKSRITSSGLKEAWLTFEIFNLFDLNNTISYYWVSDFQNQMHAVPNYLTGRRINLKASVSF